MGKEISKMFFALGTANTVTVGYEYGGLLGKIKEQTLSLHDRLSVFNESSEISLLNRNAGKNYTPLKKEACEIIAAALDISKATDGAFDITSLPLARLWKNVKAVPEKEEIEKAVSLVGYRDLKLINGAAMLTEEGMGVDLGGIAKGYAADKAKQLLTDNGAEDAVINFGGTVIVTGAEKSIGIRDPFSDGKGIFGKVLLKNKAAVTSGVYENCFTSGKKLYHHIIDPKTGYPSDNELVGVTLIGDDAVLLDGLATAAIVLGAEKSSEIIREAGAEGIFAFADGRVFITNGLKDQFEFMEDSK